MDKDSFKKYLDERYYDQLNWYDNKAAANQKCYRRFQWMLIVLSALTPVLILVEQGSILPKMWWLPLLTSVVVAVATSALKVFKYQENWINYRTTCETMRKEIHYYEAGAEAYGEVEDREALFVERVESLISRENTIWLAAQKQQKRKPS
ncbi:MAG: DUF4231 domain-containing protein [candidate division Zixibacteria bacterium]|nr:DUF4231 domain-containing protein [candidate division Zixibacteria bacterium]MDH3936136.1 DUF4231 domain-containing protein [candidate division Zixibacteria bacterium]MDH4033273.1 DUF4231 domain-containing protein [candidate division Zixibacteria bacterium]